MDSNFFIQITVSVVAGLILAALFGLIKIFRLVKDTAFQSETTSKALKKHMKREERNEESQDDRLAQLEKSLDAHNDTLDLFKRDVLSKFEDLFRALPKRKDDTSGDY